METRKEPLTKVIIKDILTLNYTRRVIRAFFYNLLIFLLFGMIFYFGFYFIPFLRTSCIIITALVLLLLLIREIYLLFLSRKGKYHICTEKLAETDVGSSNEKFLIFYRYKKYYINFVTVYDYEWQDGYTMDVGGLYNSASIGDEFYIVTFDYKRVIFAFNKKMFDLIED